MLRKQHSCLHFETIPYYGVNIIAEELLARESSEAGERKRSLELERSLCSCPGSAADLRAALGERHAGPLGHRLPAGLCLARWAPWARGLGGGRQSELSGYGTHVSSYSAHFEFHILHGCFFLFLFCQNQLTFLFPPLISLPHCQTWISFLWPGVGGVIRT